MTRAGNPFVISISAALTVLILFASALAVGVAINGSVDGRKAIMPAETGQVLSAARDVDGAYLLVVNNADGERESRRIDSFNVEVESDSSSWFERFEDDGASRYVVRLDKAALSDLKHSGSADPLE